MLEATQRSRSDFHTAFADFEDWLDRIGENVAELERLTANAQSLKDTAKRREWIQQHKAGYLRVYVSVLQFIIRLIPVVRSPENYFKDVFCGF